MIVAGVLPRSGWGGLVFAGLAVLVSALMIWELIDDDRAQPAGDAVWAGAACGGGPGGGALAAHPVRAMLLLVVPALAGVYATAGGVGWFAAYALAIMLTGLWAGRRCAKGRGLA